MKNIIYVFISFVILLTSCSSIKVEQLTSKSKINKSGIIYTLPKTQLNIYVSVIKAIYYKGPFSNYANEYLGIENVINKDTQSYILFDVNIKPTIINDNSKTYLLTNSSKKIKEYTYFEGTQVISGINTTPNYHCKKEEKKIKDIFELNFIPFKDRTIKPLVIEKSDTIWKTILVDSVYKRIPKVNKAIAPRTIKEQAYLASRFILKIRKRRLRVLTGMDKKFPKGDALKKILNELNRLENNYLALFTGITISDTTNYLYTCTPDSNIKKQNLFKFDKKYGISENANNIVSINFIDDNKNTFFNELNNIKLNSSNYVYKTAKYVRTNILLSDSIIHSSKIPLYQLGLIKTIPNSIIEEKIIFNKNTGEYSIKN